MSFNNNDNNRCFLKKGGRKLLENNIDNVSIEDKTLKMLIKRSLILEARINDLEFKIKKK